MAKVIIQPDELTTAASVLSLSPLEIKFSAPARLYRSNFSSEWEYSGAHGIVTVNVDKASSSCFIRLVDLSRKTIAMEQECYEGFEYLILADNFHAFESDDHFVGLLFAERFDAALFGKQVSQLIRLTSGGSINAPPTMNALPKPTRTSSADVTTGAGSPTLHPQPPVKRVVTTTTSTTTATTTTPTKSVEPEKRETGGSFLSKFWSKDKKQVPDKSTIKISGPKIDKFKHVSHIGFDPKKGFTEIPEEWKHIFEKAGISEDELKDKKTAKFLMQTIATVGGDSGNATFATPPPPMETGNLPKPPGSRPPPPPFKGASSSSSSTSTGGTGGGFVPPPPTNVPIVANNIPPPPSLGQTVSVSSPSGGDESGGGYSGMDMLSEIRSKKLKTVKQEDLPDVSRMQESEQNSLAHTLQKAMELRRAKVEMSSEEDDDDEDDDWEL
ncbi:hypothetical protein C9374_002487 [Naegleria lovaniensis]|uniref:Uncharacterized protein n=1 Tax=Naegleria lovaniensis TaxID=51637 RepID=A0AA88GVM4_NAELO|nr:uncharacterized protein C9374_002487 [Naegleria lovaniensis]KAG2386743.1 hypothetical protein C9374_002487 [Naegleria lovaniensis]